MLLRPNPNGWTADGGLHGEEMAEANIQWFYIGPGKKVLGPFTLVEMRKFFAAGKVQRDTLVWTKAFGDDWRCASCVQEFQDVAR